jgi:hypothetical protein
MDVLDSFGICQPAGIILLVSIAGVLYHLMAFNMSAVIWWLCVGLLGTTVFQILCRGGLEIISWTLMIIPVLILCFFFAVALFAARLRIQNFRQIPCDCCGRPIPHRSKCGCGCAPSAPA